MFDVRLAQPAATDTAVPSPAQARHWKQDPVRVLCWQSRNWVSTPFTAQTEQKLLGYFHQQPGFPFFLFFPRMKVKNMSSDMLL